MHFEVILGTVQVFFLAAAEHEAYAVVVRGGLF